MFSGRFCWSRNDCEYHLRLAKSRWVDVISSNETHDQLSNRRLRTFCQDSRSFDGHSLCSGILHCRQTCIFARYHRLFSSILSKEFSLITFVVEFFNPMISKRRWSLKNNFEHSIQYLGSIIIIIIMIISKILGSDTHVTKIWGLRAMRELQSAKSTKFNFDFSTISIAWRLFMVIRYWIKFRRKYNRVKT